MDQRRIRFYLILLFYPCIKNARNDQKFDNGGSMKKLMVGVCCLLISGSVLAGGCDSDSGTLITGKDGTKYCQSKVGLNWWSAFAWCDAIGGQLIDLTTECNKVTGTEQCPNLAGVGSGDVWTQAVPSSDFAYYVDLSSGSVSDYFRNNSILSFQALCSGF